MRVTVYKHLVLLCGVFLAGCNTLDPSTRIPIAAESISGLKVRQTKDGGETRVFISGYFQHSYYNTIRRKVVQQSEDSIRVYLFPGARSQPNSNRELELEIEIPDHINYVTLGRSNSIIWRRFDLPIFPVK